MRKEQSITAVARISKSYGVNGEVVLKLYDTFPSEVNFEEPLFVEIDKLRVPLFLSSFATRGRDKAVAVFCDLESELRMSEFIGMELYMYDDSIEVDDEDDDEEVYFEDLVGYKMFDVVSHRMGRILSHLDYENNPIFVVDVEGVEVMVPANDDIIADIYIDANVVEAEVPDGLYEFYTEQKK